MLSLANELHSIMAARRVVFPDASAARPSPGRASTVSAKLLTTKSAGGGLFVAELSGWRMLPVTDDSSMRFSNSSICGTDDLRDRRLERLRRRCFNDLSQFVKSMSSTPNVQTEKVGRVAPVHEAGLGHSMVLCRLHCC